MRPRVTSTLLALALALTLSVLAAPGQAASTDRAPGGAVTLAAVPKSTGWASCPVNNTKDYEVSFRYNAYPGPSFQLTGYQVRVRSGIGLNPPSFNSAHVSVSGGKSATIGSPYTRTANVTLYGWPIYQAPQLAAITLSAGLSPICNAAKSLT